MIQLASLSSMQAMKPTICEDAIEGDTVRLKDERDGKYYWIAKLKDGNCWMTQNLALDLSTTKALTSELSDIPTEVGSWTPTNNTQSTPSGWGSDNNAAKSYNPGNYVYTTPTMQNSCNSSTDLSACTGNGWKSISGLTPSTDPNFYKNNYDQVVTNGMYDAHYLAGNYYSWPAATAGQATNLTSSTAGQESTQSICPKGWRLPPNVGSGSYNTLFTSYGTYQNNTLLYGTQDVRLAPLYFVHGGFVVTSSLNNAGSLGRYWSSTASTASYAYILSFYTRVEPSSSDGRYSGISVRCVAR